MNYATTNKTTHDSYGLNLFYENNHGALNIRSEAYYGQNLANIGALSLGKGTDSSNVKEFGGTLTGQYKLSEKNFPFAGVGMAKVDNRTSLTPFALNATNTISSPGIRGNFLARVGWEHRVTPDLSWVSEISRYETTSKLSSVNYQLNVVGSVETGVQLRF